MSSMATKPGWPWTETASNITLDQTEERKKERKKKGRKNERNASIIMKFKNKNFLSQTGTS